MDKARATAEVINGEEKGEEKVVKKNQNLNEETFGTEFDFLAGGCMHPGLRCKRIVALVPLLGTVLLHSCFVHFSRVHTQ